MRCSFLSIVSLATVRKTGLGAILSLASSVAYAQDAANQSGGPAVVAAPNHMHEWLVYGAVAMGVLNLVLLYLLYRSPSRNREVAMMDEAGGVSRTDKRMDKRKREIDELRQLIDALTVRLANESASRLNTAQVHELVMTLVHDELTRAATYGPVVH
jgi:hypothetical protein